MSSDHPLPKPPPDQYLDNSGSLTGSQVFGIVMIGFFLLLYINFIVQMYKASTPESRQEFKERFTRRLTLSAATGTQPKPTPRKRRASALATAAEQAEVGKQRAKDILDNMVPATQEVVSVLHESTFVAIDIASSPPPLETSRTVNSLASESVDLADHGYAADAAPHEHHAITADQINELDSILMMPSTPRADNKGFDDRSGSPFRLRTPTEDSEQSLERSTHSVPSSPSPPTLLTGEESITKGSHVGGSAAVLSVPILEKPKVAPPIRSLQSQLHCSSMTQLTPDMSTRFTTIDLISQSLTRENVTTIGKDLSLLLHLFLCCPAHLGCLFAARLLASPSASVLALFIKDCGLRDFEAALIGRALLRNKVKFYVTGPASES
jgi:hypothetical protein